MEITNKNTLKQRRNKKFISLIKRLSGSLNDLRAVDKETLEDVKVDIEQIQKKIEVYLLARIRQGHNKKNNDGSQI